MKTQLSVVAHLPLLRIEEPTVEFNGMHLWRMPFDVFDGLTFHAFSDFRAEYEATAPVWLRLDGEIEAGGAIVQTYSQPSKSIDLKLGRGSWYSALEQAGLTVLARFHERIVSRTWSALALAAPAAMPPWPLASVTFAQLGEGYAFASGSDLCDTVQLRGEADLDFLFHPQLADKPLGMDALQRMAGLWNAMEAIFTEPTLAAALRSLIAASHYTLTPEEQSTLATVALEALLLPEVRSGLGPTLARRLPALLAHDAEHGERLRGIAALLYDARSAGLHGAELAPEASAAVDSAQAAQLLAASIIALHERHTGTPTQPVEVLCTLLDASERVGAPSRDATLPRLEPEGLRALRRLGPQVEQHPYRVTFSSDGISGCSGLWVMAAPLIGLGAEAAWRLDPDADSPTIEGITGSELLSLEDKDLRRDFAVQLHLCGHRIAALVFGLPDQGNLTPAGEAAEFRRLQRLRDDVVLALRLAGLDTFIDPELLGTYVKQGRRTLREPTVLRQSVLAQALFTPAEVLSAARQTQTAPAWRLVSSYAESPRHPELDQASRLFRRIHDRLFLPKIARAQLSFSLVESLLGRFRMVEATPSLETLVARALGDEAHPAAQWFAAEARGWRNELAHGRLHTIDDETPLRHLLTIGRAALNGALTAWLEQNDVLARPAKRLIRRLSA